MKKKYIDWSVTNRSDGKTYKFNACELYYGQTDDDTLTIYEKPNKQVIVVADDKFYNIMRVKLFDDLLAFKKEFFKEETVSSWFSGMRQRWFRESLIYKKVLPEEIVEL